MTMSKVAVYKNLSETFDLPFNKRNFHRQYAHIYAQRLTYFRTLLSSRAHAKWGSDLPIYKLCELEKDTRCIVVGTIFKDQPLKPSILKEISEENQLVPPPPRERFVSDTDQLVLEDELQRIHLVANVDVQRFVTGIVVAVLGIEREDALGKFQVEELLFADLGAQPAAAPCPQDTWVAFLSGFDIGNAAGDLSTVEQLKRLAESSILRDTAHLVIAGNCIGRSCSDKDAMANQARYLSRKAEAASVESMAQLDSLLKLFLTRSHVHLMPGEHDPANYILPQQPLMKVMFPEATAAAAAKSATPPPFETVTNPYYFRVGSVELLGTSGQNLSELYKYSELQDCMEQLESTLRWGHIAPTCPDTLGCYPYFDQDPFIIKSCPHVYFAGNQKEFKSKSIVGDDGQKCLLLTIPKFSSSGSCILVNLKTFECKEVKI